MNDRQLLTPSQAQDLLNVHRTTLNRWAASGAIRTYRTAGGHRRYAREDVLKIQATRLRLGLITTLGTSSDEPAPDTANPRRARDTDDST